ncbi:hypothetical protein CDD83_2256 [Cordyceps sp. RAO-2017]|nr:hypothetical protein CDD83_2256 [Cordyceps sp. RAO-2017]
MSWKAVLPLFVVGVCCAGIDFKSQMKPVNLAAMAYDTEEAQAMIDELKQEITPRGTLPYVDTKLGQKNTAFPKICDNKQIFFLRQRMILDNDSVTIDIFPNQNHHTINANKKDPITFRISKSTAKVDTVSSGWSIGGSATASVSGVFFSGSATVSGDVNGGQAKQSEWAEENVVEEECPARHICAVQTWTFTAKISGHCPTMPVANMQCLVGKKPPKRDLRKERLQAALLGGGQIPMEDPKYYNEWDKFQGRNVSLASVHGKIDEWTKLGNDYYELFKDGQRQYNVGGTTMVLHNGVWWPSDSVTVKYKDNPTCEYKYPIFLADGTPYRTQVILQRPLTSKKWSRSLDMRDSKPPQIKVKVLQTSNAKDLMKPELPENASPPEIAGVPLPAGIPEEPLSSEEPSPPNMKPPKKDGLIEEEQGDDEAGDNSI